MNRYTGDVMTLARQLLMALVLATTASLTAQNLHAADDNLLAYQLYQRGDYAQAGEIFTDPAWKGIALYRSSQWWRAAEAFIRANDAVSAYNLGNCYVKLGYYALALEAYQRALAIDPTLDDAQHNADIMRALLANDEQEEQRGGRQPSGDEIERLESDSDEAQSGEGDAGDEDGGEGEKSPAESDEQADQSRNVEQQAQSGGGGESTENNRRPDDTDIEGNGAVNGKADDVEPETGRPSGGSDTDEPSADSAAAGVRTSLETEQATTQWLNRIQHDSQLFLQRRLKLEQKRRRAAGQSPPQGGSSW